METKEVTPENIHESLKEVDPDLVEDNETGKAAKVLFAAALVGADIKRVAKSSGLSRRDVSRIVERLRKNGIWKNGRIYHSGWFDDTSEDGAGNVAFFLDVMCGAGLIERSNTYGQNDRK